MNEALIQRMQAPGPKKILACDGGGILGLMSVEILAKLEDDLRARLGRGADFVLADYFDFVCGTSTGAIIAACIAAGMSMARIRKFYEGSGEQMFDKAFILKRLNYKYNDEPLARMLQSELGKALGGDPTLGSPGLRTLLMMVMRNASTDSPWPISNNPFAKYNQVARKDNNLRLPLWQLVRASTAAPTFFPPEVVTLAEGTPDAYTFIFVDGGVTTYNNPAFLAFQMATAAPYAVNWATGVDKLLVVSVGTGGAAKGAARPEGGQHAPPLQRQHIARCADECRCRGLGHGLPPAWRVPFRRAHRPRVRQHAQLARPAGQLDHAQAVCLSALRPRCHSRRPGCIGPAGHRRASRAGDGFGQAHARHSASRQGLRPAACDHRPPARLLLTVHK